MKKLFSLFLAIMILLSAIGCASYKTKPHVSGTVLEVNEKDILIDLSEDTEGYPYGGECYVLTEGTELPAGLAAGDTVVIYYNGEIAESYPMQINVVYAIRAQ